MRQLVSLCVAMFLVVSTSGLVQAAGWGNLKIQFVYDGKAPKPAAVKVTKDQQVCGLKPLFEENLVVNPKNNGVANVIVYMRESNVPVHPELQKEAKTVKIAFDNLACRFEPHVVCVTTGQQVVLGNRDPVGHNMKVNTFANSPINPLIPAGGKFPHKFGSEERMPAEVNCAIHPWMKGWIVVRSNPYAAVSDKDGVLELKNIPAGKWEFQIWQEEIGYVDAVTIGGKKTKWRKGRPDFTIADGKTLDLGVVKFKK